MTGGGDDEPIDTDSAETPLDVARLIALGIRPDEREVPGTYVLGKKRRLRGDE